MIANKNNMIATILKQNKKIANLMFDNILGQVKITECFDGTLDKLVKKFSSNLNTFEEERYENGYIIKMKKNTKYNFSTWYRLIHFLIKQGYNISIESPEIDEKINLLLKSKKIPANISQTVQNELKSMNFLEKTYILYQLEN